MKQDLRSLSGMITETSYFGLREWLDLRRKVFGRMIDSHDKTRPNKTDAGNGSKAICRVSNVLRSPSPDPGRSAKN